MLLQDYASNAVVVTPAGLAEPNLGVYGGLQNIRKLFAIFLQPENIRRNSSMECNSE